MIDVSIVIPTYNRIDRLKKMFAALEKQDYPKTDFEVIVVSDGCSDGTNEYLKTTSSSFPFVAITQENAGAAAARNSGVKQARSEIVLFLDDDILPGPNLVREHVLHQKALEEKDIVIGPMLSPNDWQFSPWVAWEQSMLEKQYSSMINGIFTPTPRQFYTGNVSLKTEFFIQNNGFDPQFRRAEDVEFAYRARKLGGKFHFAPEIKGYHYAERSYESWEQNAYTYGVNEVRFTQEKGIGWLLPLVFREFKTRNPLMRAFIHMVLDHRGCQTNTVKLLRAVGVGAYHIKLFRMSSLMFSGIFSIQYYQGISDQLGGSKKFFSLVNDQSYLFSV